MKIKKLTLLLVIIIIMAKDTRGLEIQPGYLEGLKKMAK